MDIGAFRRVLGRGLWLLVCAAWSAAGWSAQVAVSLGGPGGSVSEFRPAGGPPLRSFSVPPGAVDALLSADGRTLWVGTTHTAVADIPAGAPSLVAALDPDTGAVLRSYPLSSSVVKMVLSPDSTRLFATALDPASGAVQVLALDLATGQVLTASVPGAQAYHLYPIGLSPDGATLCVPVTDAIRLFGTAGLIPLGSVPLAANGIVAPPWVTPDGRTLLAAGNGRAYVVDLAQQKLVNTIALTASAAAFGAVLSPDGATFYVNAGTLNVIDVPSQSLRATLALGQNNPYRLGLSPDGGTLYATDLTVATTAVIDTQALRVRQTLKSIAPPFAVAVRPNGHALLLNENANAVAVVDSDSRRVLQSFPVGDAPGTPALVAGKLFIPEVANLALQRTPLAPQPAKVLPVGFIATSSAVALGNTVYANQGSAVRWVDVQRERVGGGLLVNTGGGGLGSAFLLAATGDGQALLASYAVFAIDGGPTDGGIVWIDALTHRQQRLSSRPFVPNQIASNTGGTRAFGIGLLDSAQVGVWDLGTRTFLQKATLPGSPSYVALAVSPDGNTLYLADQKGKLDIVDALTLQWRGSVAAGPRPSGIALSQDGRQALVTDAQSTRATLLDVITPAWLGEVELGAPSTGAVFLN